MKASFKLKNNLIQMKLYHWVFKGGRFTYSTGYQIDSENWVAGSDRATESRKFPEGKTLNRALDDLALKAINLFREFQVSGERITNESFKTKLDQARGFVDAVPEEKKQLSRSFLDMWKSHMEGVKKTKANGTYTSQASSLKSFDAYMKANKIQHYKPEDILTSDLAKYNEYLAENFASNTQAKKMKHLKSFIRLLADQEEVIIRVKTTSSLLKTSETSGNKVSLGKDELTSIIGEVFEDKQLAKARDLFVIQCCVGLRVSDLLRLGKSHIQGDSFVLRAYKNQSDVSIPLIGPVKEILERYNYTLPKMCDQTYNKHIKKVYEKCYPKKTCELTRIQGGKKVLTRPLKSTVITSHVAVRTFITLAHEAGMSINNIALITGKTAKVIFKNYLQADSSRASKEFKELWGNQFNMKVA